MELDVAQLQMHVAALINNIAANLLTNAFVLELALELDALALDALLLDNVNPLLPFKKRNFDFHFSL